jgi:MFS family permease
VVGAATAAMLVAAWPPFLVAVLALQLRGIGLTVVTLGVGVALFFVTAAVLSPLGGELVRRWGPEPALRIVTGVSAVVCGLLVVAASPAHVLVLLVLAGAVNALVQPATGALIRAGAPLRSHGVSLGIVQASVPMTIVASAATIPLVLYASNWRLAFVVAAAVSVAAFVLVPRRRASASPERTLRQGVSRPSGVVLPFLVTALLAATAASALSTYASTTGHDLGLDTAPVAAWVAASGLVCAVMRVVSGRVAGSGSGRDAGRGMVVMIVLFVVGGSGYAALATGDPALFGPGLVVGYGFGWAFPGVLNFVIGASTDDATRSTGWTQVGVFGGSALGPLVFALIASGTGDLRLGWAACAAYVAAALVVTVVIAIRRRNQPPIR